MSLRAKLLLIVAAAALGFGLVIVLTALINSRETRELKAIEARFLPRLELGPRLDGDFERLGRTMQDAVAAQDRQTLDQAAAVRDRMFERVDAGREAIGAPQAAAIKQKVGEYFEAAHDVSRRLINKETGEEIVSAMAAMQAKQAAAADILGRATSLDHRELADHFAAIEAAQTTATRLRLVISVACLTLVLFLSIKMSREVLAAVTNLSRGFGRFGSGDFNQPIPTTTDDEIGRLSAEANQMAERLRQTLDHLAATSADLARANEELQAFSYSVAHDLRAPLRAINGFATALVEDIGESLRGDARDYLERITAGAGRMGLLIDALLGLSRVTRTELVRGPVDLSKAAHSVIARLRTNDPERSVEFVAPEQLIVTADHQLVLALLENLLGNAWKFTSKREAARIELGYVKHEGAWAYFVRDNGAGFDMAYAGKLFAPFQRLHAAAEFGGTGIGLATVQRIVRRHGGQIWAEGAVDQGATFYFTLESGRGGGSEGPPGNLPGLGTR